MDTIHILVNTGLALLIGGLIGIEREKSHTGNTQRLKFETKPKTIMSFGGLRTHLLFSVLGLLSGFLIISGYVGIAAVITAGFILFIISSYILGYIKLKLTGLTSEIGAIIAYTLSMLIMIETIPTNVVIALAVILAVILGMKKQVRVFVEGFSKNEVLDMIKFALVALVILPFLPNTWFTLGDIDAFQNVLHAIGATGVDKILTTELFNPFKLWFIVVFVSGLDLVGYILNKFFSSSGELMTGISGGFVTSTSTVQALAVRAKKLADNSAVRLGAIAALANSASYIETLIMIAPINSTFFIRVIPFLLSLIITGFVVGFWIYHRNKELHPDKPQEQERKSPKGTFDILPAVKFAAILFVVQVVSKIALALFGNTALYITSIIAALTGIDAVVINLSDLSRSTITLDIALYTLIAVTAVNTIAKVIYSRIMGNKTFMKTFLLIVGGTYALSLLIALLIRI